ncbi:MAG: pyridoxal phosphate-dependent aminotransferase [Lachnospiraceae bacterium]|nr:pyridoxal phosphate-dependent aminotransferase [Lachnospiraceae bacterium]
MKMIYDFDTVYDRRNTNSLKWDFAAERHHSEDELSLWVADMDFRSPDPILKALHDVVDRGFFGYTADKKEDREIVCSWFERRHGYAYDPEDMIFAPGVVYALTQAVNGITEPGDAVMISEPVYYPFSALVKDAGRRLVRNVLIHDEEEHYGIDFDIFEKQIKDNDVKVYILCSPHNPVGRVWTKEELLKIGDICLANKVTVFSDEIHADFVYGDNKHIPFASISPEFEQNSVTFTSPSKTFNLAGLQIAEIIARDEKKRAAVKKAVNATGYAEVPVTGLAAMRAAYTECDGWVDETVSYIWKNILYMKDHIDEKIPQLKMKLPEGTYLPWVDCRSLGYDRKELEDLIRNRAKLWLDAGYIFGESGTGWQRFNAACPKSIIVEVMDRLEKAVNERI